MLVQRVPFTLMEVSSGIFDKVVYLEIPRNGCGMNKKCHNVNALK